ncbi:sulfite exporter TauE/SafE family protein [Mucilaginibacter lutimaris]|uniref:Probable membrane transporter protein n=1 Tax=Mucilaginibacter lutimaris TaxID=931629 RepID=A0ABW2ZCD6_9SPHI
MTLSFLSIALFAASFIAFVISGICGGGASFILLPLLGLFLPVTQIPAAISLGSLTSSISRLAIFKKNVRWDIVGYFVPTALPAVWLGAKFITLINPLFMQLTIGVFLAINLPMMFVPFDGARTMAKGSSKFTIAIIGFATGFLSGLTGAVGLLFNRFYLTRGLSKEEIIATRAANELLLHILKLALYAFFGLVTIKSVSVGLVVAFTAIISSLLMKPILRAISEKFFRKIGITAMVSLGCFMLFNSIDLLISRDNLALKLVDVENGFETKVSYRQQAFSVEFEYDEGFETEHTINFSDLSDRLQNQVAYLKKDADKVILEEVYGFSKHYVEVNLYHGNKLTEFELK